MVCLLPRNGPRNFAFAWRKVRARRPRNNIGAGDRELSCQRLNGAAFSPTGKRRTQSSSRSPVSRRCGTAEFYEGCPAIIRKSSQKFQLLMYQRSSWILSFHRRDICRFAAKAMHLGPARDARFDVMAESIVVDRIRVLSSWATAWGRGPISDMSATEHVEQLRQLVNAGRSQQTSDPLVTRWSPRLACWMHGPSS